MGILTLFSFSNSVTKRQRPNWSLSGISNGFPVLKSNINPRLEWSIEVVIQSQSVQKIWNLGAASPVLVSGLSWPAVSKFIMKRSDFSIGTILASTRCREELRLLMRVDEICTLYHSRSLCQLSTRFLEVTKSSLFTFSAEGPSENMYRNYTKMPHDRENPSSLYVLLWNRV